MFAASRLVKGCPDTRHVLRTTDIRRLAELDEPESRLLSRLGAEIPFEDGDRIIEEGDRADSFFIVRDGMIRVCRQGEEVAMLARGDILGEMALFNDNVRTGEAVGVGSGSLLRVDLDHFFTQVLHQDPAAVKLMARLGETMVMRLLDEDAELVRRVAADDPALAERLQGFGVLRQRLLADWALKYHSIGRPGKLEIRATKPARSAHDLSVAYSPGVAEPCLKIQHDPERAYELTAKGHLVAVVTNGTAVLGLGDIGAQAAKPVMEGKAVLFKRFADIDAFDLEVDARDPDRFIEIVCALGPTFGGINLEDIRAPECFRIETECARRLDIPVFHDDQHGTAIVAGAALLNALDVVGKNIDEIRVAFSGAGAAGFACAKYFLGLGVARNNLLLCDVRGVVHEGRGDCNYLDELAAVTEARTLAEAVEDADVFMGLSVGGVLTADRVRRMARDPIVFALANPVPEIAYDTALQTRRDAIIGTGRSDYPNQVNNVVAFPYIFRGALDTRARAINGAMMMAATKAIAALARRPVTPDAGFDARGLRFGRQYLIPKPFDHRLLPEVASAVAAAAVRSGAARLSPDPDTYRLQLERPVPE
jgi:malic enzyme